jgi:N6-adenosine-specific RNA methylase IME4
VVRPTTPVIPFHDLTNQPDEAPDPHALIPHPLAEVFPLMNKEEFDQLVTDIEQNGVLQPLTLYRGHILDGRNRYNAWLEAIQTVPGIPLPREEFTGPDPVTFVMSANYHRRNLNESQRGMVVARITEHQKRGRPRKDNGEQAALTQDAIAKMLRVSTDTAQRSRHVLERGTQRLIARVDSGELPVALVTKVATMSTEDQRRLEELPEAAMRSAWRRRRRERKERELAHSIQVATSRLGTQVYGVIYANPPWRTDQSDWRNVPRVSELVTGSMSTVEIANLEVPSAANAVLFLWARPTMLSEAWEVITAWGFTYRDQLVWLKKTPQNEYWTLSGHELLLIATKGYVPPPTNSERPNSAMPQDLPKGLRRKPEAFRTMIERLFPTVPRLEVFGTGNPAPGWSQYRPHTMEAAAE